MLKLRYCAISFICFVCAVRVLSTVEPEKDLTAALKNFKIMGAGISEENFDRNPPTEQQKIDTIKSALNKLPNSELARLGVDIDGHFEAGSQRANRLVEAWNQRQQELKDALAGVLKPVEYMQDIVNILRNTSLDNPAVIENLVVLESLLADVDNARDFHTIGGWNVMNNIFQTPAAPTAVKAAIALCVGTAVKNNYDYQMWVLEVPSPLENRTDQSESGIPLIQAMADSLRREALDGTSSSVPDWTRTERLGLVNNLLYGVFAACRGNIDVQEAIQTSAASFLPSLTQLVQAVIAPSVGLPPDGQTDSLRTAVLRKVWAFVSDMLEEWLYIHGPGGLASGEHGEEVREAALRLHPLGALIVRNPWWLSQSSDLVWALSNPCLVPSQGGQHVQSSGDDSVGSVPSATPANVPTSVQSTGFNEECLVLSSASHRALYKAAFDVRKVLRNYGRMGESDVEYVIADEQVRADSIELSCHLLNKHPLFSDWDGGLLVNDVLTGE